MEESKKLRMNFDFKNVQRRVYDALNVLTALDMIKKDRNKIEFIRDIHEVFGDENNHNLYTPETKTKEERQAEINAQIENIKRKKAAIKNKIKQKRQYFDEITVQVALLKKLVRRNMKKEENDTTVNTPDKRIKENLTLDNFQKTKKI